MSNDTETFIFGLLFGFIVGAIVMAMGVTFGWVSL